MLRRLIAALWRRRTISPSAEVRDAVLKGLEDLRGTDPRVSELRRLRERLESLAKHASGHSGRGSGDKD
ncbi:MAG: hypothetical protein NZ953_03050 [Thaumarchaeota archaeon]|nr:hypothetical protein [Candidatus Calditenuaceae archaeon]MCX8203549.1 hypothetical protein [Nitrososphaeria archaeon]MDW8042854.1 hypothetical protein [Nitrososphaerota archaeon]